MPSSLPSVAQSVASQQDLSPTASHIWAGQSRIHVPALAGDQCCTVQLHVVVFHVGSYRLSDYSVAWTFPELGNLSGTVACPAVVFQVSDAGL